MELWLPGLLQAAVVIFGMGLMLFLLDYSSTLSIIVDMLAFLALGLLLRSSYVAFKDPYSPFHSSLSELIAAMGFFRLRFMKNKPSIKVPDRNDTEKRNSRRWFSPRPQDSDEKLQAGIAARLLQNSDDLRSIQLTAANVLTLDPETLSLLSEDRGAMSALHRQFTVEDDKETAAILSCAITHLWMTGRRNIGRTWEALDGWYGDPVVVASATKTYISSINGFKTFTSSTIPTILVNMLQRPHYHLETLDQLLEKVVFDPRNLGLLACYLLWIPNVLSNSLLPRFTNPTISNAEEDPPRNACEGVAAMYQEFIG